MLHGGRSAVRGLLALGQRAQPLPERLCSRQGSSSRARRRSLPLPSPPCRFYINSGYDLSFIWDQPDPPGLAWEQFLTMGLYEGRPYRFTC